MLRTETPAKLWYDFWLKASSLPSSFYSGQSAALYSALRVVLCDGFGPRLQLTCACRGRRQIRTGWGRRKELRWLLPQSCCWCRGWMSQLLWLQGLGTQTQKIPHLHEYTHIHTHTFVHVQRFRHSLWMLDLCSSCLLRLNFNLLHYLDKNIPQLDSYGLLCVPLHRNMKSILFVVLC